ncbi:MAG: hypothetical protein JRC60_02595 [Deltaproteobacteria bacterium]|nr:hypothetical protein [Deltaproteobacteria bacterium]
MKKATFYFLITLFLTGCVTTPEKMKMLDEQNRNLTANLQTAKNRVVELENEKTELISTLKKQTNISNTLEKEKDVGIEETGNLRQNIRAFLKTQMFSFREFSQKSDFLDYVGGGLIDRKKSEGQNVTLVDMKNRIPDGGPLLGTWGYFTSPCAYSINILRKVNDEWFVVWQAGPFNAAGTKLQRFDFSVPVSSEKGDVIAYTFMGPVGVPYSRGTGEMLYVTGELKIGSKVLASKLSGKSDQRSYSIGVVGILK